MRKDAIFRWINCRDVGIILMDVGVKVRRTRSLMPWIFNLRLSINGLKGAPEMIFNCLTRQSSPEILE